MNGVKVLGGISKTGLLREAKIENMGGTEKHLSPRICLNVKTVITFSIVFLVRNKPK